MNGYSMPRYFQTMPTIGKPIDSPNEENTAIVKAVEDELRALRDKILATGRPDESLNSTGQLTAMQRITALVDEGSWHPLNSLFNPAGNPNGSTSIVKGLGSINGRWAVIIASDNKKAAGTWVPGQAENLLRASDTAKLLRIPLIYLLNCAGV